MSKIDGDLQVTGTLTMGATTLPDNAITANSQVKVGAAIARTKLAQETTIEFPVPLTSMRVWNAPGTNLPNTAGGTDDLYIDAGTWGTDSITLKSDDGASTTVTQYAVFEIPIPECYEASETFEIDVRAKMATISDGTATVDLEVYEIDGDGAVGSDLCATAAQSINATSYATKTFTITDAGLAAGDKLECRMAIAITDAATGSGVVAHVSKVSAMCDIRG